MSNILIIKHGSLGDIAQISGVIRDIRETYNKEKVFILTTAPYVELLSRCPYVDGVLIDKRLPRWNILYLLKLRKNIKSLIFHMFMIYKILHEHLFTENINLIFQTGVAQKQH